MTYWWIREGEFHSKYKGYDIVKVTHKGRTSYDVYLEGDPVFWAEETLRLAKLSIDALN